MPLNCCNVREKCLPEIPETLLADLIHLQGLDVNGCDRYESATALVTRLQTPFTGVGANGIVVEQPEDDTAFGHAPTIYFDDCQWVVTVGTVQSILGKDGDNCVVRENLESFTLRTETPFEPISDGSIASVAGGIAGHQPTLSVRLATDQGAGENQIQLVPGENGGLYVPPVDIGDFEETSITPEDSATLHLEVSGPANHTITGDVQISVTEDNLLVVEPDGLFVGRNDANIPLSKDDTPSIVFTLTGDANHTVSADLQISADAGNLATVNADGLFVPNNESLQTPITGNNSNSITIATSGTDDHTIEAAVIISEEACNAVAVLADPLSPGLFVLGYQSGYTQLDFAEEPVLVGAIGDLTEIVGDYAYNGTINELPVDVLMPCDRTGTLRAEVQSIPLRIENTVNSRLLVRREYRVDSGAWETGRTDTYYLNVPVGKHTFLLPEEWFDIGFINTTGSHTVEVRVLWAEEIDAPDFVSFSGTLIILPYSIRARFYDANTFMLF